MFHKQNFISIIAVFLGLANALQGQTFSSEIILLETPYGNMKLRLYEETPLHKNNFLKLVREQFFDSTTFHRVINYFMIQGGDPLSRRAKAGDSLGHGDLGYTVPAEIHRQIIHQKGRLCAARESDNINPLFASSASQFYIVMGKKRTPEDLAKYEERINKNHYNNCANQFLSAPEGLRLHQLRKKLANSNKKDSADLITKQIDGFVMAEHLKTPLYKFNQREMDVYTTIGGTPHLDGTYTVFGEVVEGLEVIDKIAAVNTDKRDRPLVDVRIRMKVIKD